MRRMRRDRLQEALSAYAMLLPDVAGLLVFVFIPIVYAFVVSLHSWNGLKPWVFTGADNYKRLLADSVFWKSLLTTVRYAVLYVPSVFVLSFGLAILVNSIRGTKQQVFRTLLFVPFAISTVVAALAWSFIYDPMRGYLNGFLALFRVPAQPFLGAMEQALPSVAVVGIWLVIGYYMVIFLAAIKDIPQTYFEAAEIDGANPWQKLIYITIPSVRDSSLFVAIVTTIGSFQVFDQIQVMTRGGPAAATNVTVYYIFRQAFEISELGYASATAFILFLIIMALTLVQLRVFSPAQTR
ncbi:MAG TPA: sugar ABC transporter permease [Spirochaetia bacterium]|nr:sugar ABC transporter permease [Spirochaetia bacterium]